MPTDRYLGQAFAHPLRVDVIVALEGGRRASPTQIAEQLGEKLPNLSYHVRQLVALGVLEDAGTQPVRGAIEHFYKLALTPAEILMFLLEQAAPSGSPPPAPRRDARAGVLELIRSRGSASQKEIAEATGINAGTVSTVCRQLGEREQLVQNGVDGRSPVWRIPDKSDSSDGEDDGAAAAGAAPPAERTGLSPRTEKSLARAAAEPPAAGNGNGKSSGAASRVHALLRERGAMTVQAIAAELDEHPAVVAQELAELQRRTPPEAEKQFNKYVAVGG